MVHMGTYVSEIANTGKSLDIGINEQQDYMHLNLTVAIFCSNSFKIKNGHNRCELAYLTTLL